MSHKYTYVIEMHFHKDDYNHGMYHQQRARGRLLVACVHSNSRKLS